MEQATFPFDSCARKHRGNPRSVAANLRAHPHKHQDRLAIHMAVASQGFAGLTLKEIRIWHPTENRWKLPNEYSGRISEINSDLTAFPELRIYKANRRRLGCEVYVSRPEWVTPQ